MWPVIAAHSWRFVARSCSSVLSGVCSALKEATSDKAATARSVSTLAEMGPFCRNLMLQRLNQTWRVYLRVVQALAADSQVSA